MFAALMNRAQATVDNAIGQAFNRALIAIPFVLAGAFATAALAFRLVREFGPETANLILACIFLVVGLVCAAAFRTRPASAATIDEAVPASLSGSEEQQSAGAPLDGPDRELLLAAATSAAPIAIPALLRAIIRNLPLVLAVLSAIFVLTRPDVTEPEKAEAGAQ